jgi:nitroimidazol reductase NimA-like FMN-containing flavoprotein (pyridoxamine 5'-phosphate oxidase superfamily)
MTRIEEMTREEMQALLREMSFGHLGCVREARPYVVPMHYAYDGENLYFLTTEGTKTDCIAAHAEVCLQVEIVDDASHWRSVLCNGRAERLERPDELEQATQLLTQSNPALTPALTPAQGAGSVAIYRIRPDSLEGRKAG